MTPSRRFELGRLAPGGDGISAAVVRHALVDPVPEARLRRDLSERLGTDAIEFFVSGRAALRAAFERARLDSARNEVVVPAYSCFSVPAAAVAAGLRVRLVDVDARGRIDLDALSQLRLENVLAVVVCNLFGIPEDCGQISRLVSGAGIRVIDDAAQSLGAVAGDGIPGARGDFGILSFGRGKPLAALGGGALVGGTGGGTDPRHVGAPDRLRAGLRAVVWDVARQPVVFRRLSEIPSLGIGETPFEPGFATGAIDPASACLAAAACSEFDEARARRVEHAQSVAEALEGVAGIQVLLAQPPETGAYPRAACVARDAGQRARLLESMRPLGASPFYPSSLDDLESLRASRAGEGPCRQAQDLAGRLFTLPTHTRLDVDRLRQLAEEAVKP